MFSAKISDEKLSAILKNIGKYPFLIAGFASFGLAPICWGSNEYFSANATYVALFVLYILFFLKFLLIIKNNKPRNKEVIFFCAKIILFTAFAFYLLKSQYKGLLIFVFGLWAISILYCIVQSNEKSLKGKCDIVLLSLVGFLIRMCYVLQTNITVRQNDVWNFFDSKEINGGHAGYIEYILTHHHLPDFNPTEIWQYYHPPLHHIISAIWLQLCKFLGADYEKACESLQCFSLFYGCVLIILAYKIFHQFQLSGNSLLAPFKIVCVFPYLIYMSGAINNDPLAICFFMGAIYNTVIWYKNQITRNILKIALCIGLGMMTKLSVGAVAPSIAVVFLVTVIQNRKKLLVYIKQYLAFAIVCCPLGLWWSIRNLIKFDVSINFVPALSENASQYIGNMSFFSRITDFSLSNFASVFESWGENGDAFKDFNPTITVFKNSMFSESIYEESFPDFALFVPTALFWVAVIVALLAFSGMIAMCMKKQSSNDRLMKILLLGEYFPLLVSYYSFCYNYPFICTMNFRYIVPCMFVSLVGYGYSVKYCETINGKFLKNILIALPNVFFSASILMFTLLFLGNV